MDDESLKKEFPGNSYSGIEPNNKEVPDLENKATENVPAEKSKTTKPVKPKKETIGEHIVDSIRSIDPVELFRGIVYNWIFPGLQAAGEEILRIIFNPNGAARGTGANGRTGRNGKLRYHRDSITGGALSGNIGSKFKPQIVFPYREWADGVVSGAMEYIDDYGKLPMKEFYSIVDDVTEGKISIGADWATLRYGWRNLEGIDVSRTRDGWLLTMPKAEDLK